MAIDRMYEQLNRAQRERMKTLASKSDAELARPLDAGWTVAAVLAHLAFWDQRAILLIEQWEKAGPAGLPNPLNEKDVDWVNDAAKPMFLAIPPRRAAELALSIAEAVDRKIEGLSDEFLGRNAAAGHPLNVIRAEHRRQHLDQIALADR